jgi:hypothetical protein
VGTVEDRREHYRAYGAQIAALCRLTGANEALSQEWTAEGRRCRMTKGSCTSPQLVLARF